MHRIHLISTLLFLLSCRNPTQAKSYSYGEIGHTTDQRDPERNSPGTQNSSTGSQQGSLQQNLGTQNNTSLVGGRACNPSETAMMKKLFPKDCYFMRRVPEKGKEVMLGGKCIEKTSQVFVGQKSGDFYFICYLNQTGFLHEDAFD